jgi:hypothetical protein
MGHEVSVTIRVELNPEMERQLAAEALARKASNVPQLRTETFSREMIYGEHA